MKVNLQSCEALFSGPSETATLLRQIDWSQTPLGPVETWPQSLKTTLRIMLTSRQPIWVGWGSELIYFYNDAYRAVVGGKHPHALGQPLQQVWHEIWDHVGPMLHTAMASTEGVYVEEQLFIMERNGYSEETYYTFSFSPIPDDDNRTGGIICANTDDTQRVIHERQLFLLRKIAEQKSNDLSWPQVASQCVQALAHNPHDLTFALLYLPDEASGQEGVYLAGTTGFEAPHDAAPASMEYDGGSWPIADVLGHQRAAVVPLDSRFRDPLPLGAWQTASAQAAIIPVPISGRGNSAGALIVGLSPVRLFDENYRSFLDLVAGQIGAEISSAKNYEYEKKRAEALAELDRAKTVFFSNISHEFRTPLTLILGPLKEAMRNLAVDSTVLQELSVAHTNSLRLLKLVNSLLDFSRVEAGRMQAAYAPYDLLALTQELVSNFTSAFERAGIRLVLDGEALPEPVYLDRDMWEKIVFNLLSNALKFTLSGEVNVSVVQQGRFAILRVQDSGVGIDEADLPHVFKRFYRVEQGRGRSHEGTGIGLALAKELVELHGGDVTVTSVVNEGSTFLVRIPLGITHLASDNLIAASNRAHDDNRALAFVEEALRWLPAQTGNDVEKKPFNPQLPTILLADDNRDMRHYIERILSPKYNIIAVADGSAALAQAISQPPSLIIADVMMPGMDGFALLNALKTHPVLNAIPVILLSARAGEEARVEGVKAGADDYLEKPFSARDLLARVKAQLYKDDQRKEQESHFRFIADNAPVILWTTSPDGRCTYLSKHWYEYTGGAHGGDLDFSWMSKIHEDDCPPAMAIFLEANRLQQPFRVEYRLLGADGRYHWVIDTGSPRFDSDGNYLGFVGCVFDIAERRRMEAIIDGQKSALELGINNAPLENMLSVFAQTLELQSDNHIRVSILLFDEARQRLFHGASPSLPQAFRELAHDLPIGVATGPNGEAAYSREPVFVADISTSPLYEKFKHVASQEGLRSCWSKPIFARDRRLLATVALYYIEPRTEPDPTDARMVSIVAGTLGLVIGKTVEANKRREADEKLRASEAALRESDVRKDEFLATLAHELRNPLAPISNALQVMALSPNQATHIEMRALIERQLAQMVRLVDDLMDVSRITRGKVELRKAPHLVSALVNNAVEGAQPLMNSRQQSLAVSVPSDEIWLDADFTRMSQVLINILNNASKYTQAGGHIALTVKTFGNDVKISVQDNGRGIAKDKLDTIFDMFTQIEEPLCRSVGGLGLGLTLAKQLVDLHDGRLIATSEGLGLGSCFSIVLPTTQAPLLLESEPVAVTSRTNTQRHVFIVDDNQESARTLGEIIELFGHQVSIFHDGLSAIAAAQSQSPDMVLLDIGMPGMNGYEVCEALGSLPHLQQTQMVAQTGWSDKSHRERALQAGFDHHLVKPIDIASLKGLLDIL